LRSPKRSRAPDLVRKYLGSVVHTTTTSSRPELCGVHGRLVRLHPKGVRCPLELSTYFRSMRRRPDSSSARSSSPKKGATSATSRCSARSGTRISCTRPSGARGARRRHDQVSTIQNWYPGARKAAAGSTTSSPSAARAAARLEDSWTQVETGGDHLEVSRLLLQGDNSIGEFYSVAVTNQRQQADTGTK